MIRRHRSHPGVALIELVGALVLAAAFSFVSAKLFHSTIRIAQSARQAPARDVLRDELIDRVRQDVWGASEIVVADERTLVLRYIAGESVFWRIEPDGPAMSRNALHRTRPQELNRWAPAHLPLRFEAQGPGVRIDWPVRPGDAPRSIAFYSQVVLFAVR